MIEIHRVGPVLQFKFSRTFFGKTIRSTAAYYLDGLLIDSGYAHAAKQFVQVLVERPIHTLVHTHTHEDHVGANFLLQKQRQIEARAHPEAPLRLKNQFPLKFYRRFVWGTPLQTQIKPLQNQIETDKHKFEIIYLPGHSIDHVGFYEPHEGWFFAGDLFLGVKVRVLHKEECFTQHLHSLRKALQLPMQYLFCGSGKILTQPHEFLKIKLEFFEEIQHHVLDLWAKGWEPSKIRDQVLGREGFLTYFSQGEFSKLNMVKKIIEENLYGHQKKSSSSQLW